jgi:hypothetical protein
LGISGSLFKGVAGGFFRTPENAAAKRCKAFWRRIFSASIERVCTVFSDAPQTARICPHRVRERYRENTRPRPDWKTFSIPKIFSPGM